MSVMDEVIPNMTHEQVLTVGNIISDMYGTKMKLLYDIEKLAVRVRYSNLNEDEALKLFSEDLVTVVRGVLASKNPMQSCRHAVNLSKYYIYNQSTP